MKNSVQTQTEKGDALKQIVSKSEFANYTEEELEEWEQKSINESRAEIKKSKLKFKKLIKETKKTITQKVDSGETTWEKEYNSLLDNFIGGFLDKA